MTLFDDNRYDWRETYFVYFESTHRPKLSAFRRALKTDAPFLTILSCKADSDGYLVEMTIASYEDHAALEIIYREGNDILAESLHLARSLKNEATAIELSQLQKIAQCKTRLDVHHFEQLEDTGAFNITKLPELKFSRQSTLPADRRDVFAKALGTDDVKKGQFHFDSNSYEQCRSSNADGKLGATDAIGGDSGEFERINPEMLVTVLEILCRLSHGIALDPASGIVLD